ncbi:MAG: FAD-binding protein, partial [Phascolarctobacterium sp.]|nr:FAD-binding protein [Phascolarctobacterium sp.]
QHRGSGGGHENSEPLQGAGNAKKCGDQRLLRRTVFGGIVLFMERMDKILEVNKKSLYLVAEVCARTIDIQERENEEGLLYASDHCSAEGCTIGGNLATNAGGDKAVRYGVTRHQVYGFEMVTTMGKIVNLGLRLKKCSTGYCMEQMVIGSEGTLGIITKVTLKLLPKPPYRFDLLAIFDDPYKAVDLVPMVLAADINPTSLEFMDNMNVRYTAQYTEFMEAPHYEDGNYIIITVECFAEDEMDMKMEKLDKICEEASTIEVLEADDCIWSMRRNCQEGIWLLSLVCMTDDIVVPVDQVAVVIKDVTEISKKYSFPISFLSHIGDGNIHIFVSKCDATDEEWETGVEAFHNEIYDYVYKIGGRMSGEHGIGLKKIDYMEKFTDPVELGLMKKIKKARDPNLILNPGKIFKM